jgi:hypothetical protein
MFMFKFWFFCLYKQKDFIILMFFYLFFFFFCFFFFFWNIILSWNFVSESVFGWTQHKEFPFNMLYCIQYHNFTCCFVWL